MNQLEDLKLLCDKFVRKQYSVEELSQALSWIAVPKGMRIIIDEAEYGLENIRFCVSDNKQYEEALKIVNGILAEIEKIS